MIAGHKTASSVATWAATGTRALRATLICDVQRARAWSRARRQQGRQEALESTTWPRN